MEMQDVASWFASASAWLNAMQRGTSRALSQHMSQLEALDTTTLIAAAFAFALGMLHAASPGHGKIVVFSYFLGREERPWAGVLLALKIAATHIGTAIALFFALDLAQTVFFGRPAGPARALQAASYLAITVIGATLLYGALRARDSTTFTSAATANSLRSRALPFAIGLLPCPLTLLILSYALANATLAAGLFLVAVMGLGIAATIAIVALFGMIVRLTALKAVSAERVMAAQRIFQIGSNVLIVAIGLVLFLLAIQ